MRIRLSAVATLSVASLLVMAVAAGAGCSSTTTTTTTVADSGADTSAPRPVAPAPEDAGPQTCPTTDPIVAAQLPYAQPTPLSLACTPADYQATLDLLNKNPNISFAELDAFFSARGKKCHDCVFADSSGGTWGPIPFQNGQLVTVNVGGCFTIVTGNKALGQAIQNYIDCERTACGDCVDQTEYDNCTAKADQGACKQILADARKAYQAADPNLVGRCGTFPDAVREQCVGPIPDAGTDGGDDAGDGGDDAGDAGDADAN